MGNILHHVFHSILMCLAQDCANTEVAGVRVKLIWQVNSRISDYIVRCQSLLQTVKGRLTLTAPDEFLPFLSELSKGL